RQGLNNRDAKRAIKRMKYRAGGKTLTGDALRVVNRYIFNEKNGDRPGVPDVLILFTDGKAHDFNKAKKHAKEMRGRNIRIIAIAAVEQANNPKLVEQLRKITFDPLEVYKSEFSELTDIVDKLID
uniref:vWA domain-containing protein n=1 Tax=Salmonella sp. s54412 TaxID=3160128 RepID=UPI003754A12B